MELNIKITGSGNSVQISQALKELSRVIMQTHPMDLIKAKTLEGPILNAEIIDADEKQQTQG